MRWDGPNVLARDRCFLTARKKKAKVETHSVLEPVCKSSSHEASLICYEDPTSEATGRDLTKRITRRF
jgi:hypothetical protein